MLNLKIVHEVAGSKEQDALNECLNLNAFQLFVVLVTFLLLTKVDEELLLVVN